MFLFQTFKYLKLHILLILMEKDLDNSNGGFQPHYVTLNGERVEIDTKFGTDKDKTKILIAKYHHFYFDENGNFQKEIIKIILKNGDFLIPILGSYDNAYNFIGTYGKTFSDVLSYIGKINDYHYFKNKVLEIGENKCYICGRKTDDLEVSKRKIYESKDDKNLTQMQKYKKIIYNHNLLTGENSPYILLCKRDSDRRKKLIFRMIKEYTEKLQNGEIKNNEYKPRESLIQLAKEYNMLDKLEDFFPFKIKIDYK